MKAKKIKKQDIKDILIASLPTRPTAPIALGGKGYRAGEMKEAFDKLPLYIIERYNELLEDIEALGENSLAAAIPSGISDTHTLNTLFEDVASGNLATYFTFLGKSLIEHVLYVYSELDEMKKALDKLQWKETTA